MYPCGGLLASGRQGILLRVSSLFLRSYLRISILLTPAHPDRRYGSTDQSEVYLAVVLTNVFNMALDVMIFILPIPLLFQSDTQRNTRIGLLVLFGIGIV